MEKKNGGHLTLGRSMKSPRDFGFSLVETMVAVAIVGTAVAGLSGALLSMKQANDKSKTIYSALTLQSQITGAISDEDNFRSSGAALALPSVRFKVGKPAPAHVSLAPGVTQFFTNDFDTCTAFGGSCTLSVVYDFQDDGTGLIRAAYRVRSSPTLDLSIANLGAPGTGAFAAGDYRLPLPDLVWKAQNTFGCTGATDLALMGFNRNTGVAICLKKPVGQPNCPTGGATARLAKTFKVDHTAPGGPQMVVDCQMGGGQPAKAWTCPTAEYVLQSIPDPRVFDASYTAGGSPTCVWRAASSEVIPTTSTAENLVGTVCPRPPSGSAYAQTTTTCSFSNGPQSAGGCMTIPACPTSIVPFGATVLPTFNPAVVGGDSISCTTNPGLTAPGGGCFPGSYSAIWYGRTTFGPRTCNLTKPLTESAI